jgi:hypothetical protein
LIRVKRNARIRRDTGPGPKRRRRAARPAGFRQCDLSAISDDEAGLDFIGQLTTRGTNER